MATTEEKQELIETIKRPIRYYRIQLWGYGGEAAYIKLNKEQFEFWNNVKEEHGDTDIVNYMVSAEDGDFDFEDIEEVPANADFMKNPDDDTYCSWYEHHNEITHQYGVDYSNANISIEEVDSDEYMAKYIADVVDSETLSEYIENLHEEMDYETELVQMDCCEEEEDKYTLQFWSSEKGTFFEGIFASNGTFDPKKLKIYTTEYFNGDDTVESIEYDGVEIDNQGGDTNGKGYYVHLWENE